MTVCAGKRHLKIIASAGFGAMKTALGEDMKGASCAGKEMLTYLENGMMQVEAFCASMTGEMSTVLCMLCKGFIGWVLSHDGGGACSVDQVGSRVRAL